MRRRMHSLASHLSALNGLYRRRGLWRSAAPLRKERPQRLVSLIRLGLICSVHSCSTQHPAECLCNVPAPFETKEGAKDVVMKGAMP